MANYPTLPQAEGTQLVPRSGNRNRRAVNGPVGHRPLSTGTRWDPQVKHVGLTLAQWTELQDFAEAQRGTPFDLAYQPEARTLSCVFADTPFSNISPWQSASGARFDVTSNLLQAD